MDTRLCGVLLVDKPAGPTSHDIVAQVRRLTGVSKVGHGGTLDPFATGLLLLMMGKATRLFDFLAPLNKRYEVTVQFGAVSSTGDIDGEISAVHGPVIGVAELREVLPRFVGSITQRPPSYSAIKVGGERLYKKARRGELAEGPARRVVISDLRLNRFDETGQRAELEVVCSKGTYIRSLCEDIARRLGTGAYAAALRRTAIGDFKAGDAATLEKLKTLPPVEALGPANPSFISCIGALYFLPVREVSEKEAREVASGRPLKGVSSEPVRIGYKGGLLAVYGPGQGMLRPLVVLG